MRKNQGWYKVDREVWELDVQPKAKLVMLALMAFADERCCCWPSTALLCKQTGLGRCSVMKALKDLARVGAILVDKRRGRRSHFFLAICAGICPATKLGPKSSASETGSSPESCSNPSAEQPRAASVSVADAACLEPRPDVSEIETTTSLQSRRHELDSENKTHEREVHAPSATSPLQPEPEEPQGTALQDLIDHFARGWAESNGAPIAAFAKNGQGGAAGKGLKNLLEVGEDPDQLQAVMDFYFSSNEPHYVRTGHRITVFVQNYYPLKQQMEAFRNGDIGPVRHREPAASGRGSRRPLR